MGIQHGTRSSAAKWPPPQPQEPTHEQVAVCSALQVKAVAQHLAGRLHLGRQPGQLRWLQAVQPLALRQRSSMGISSERQGEKWTSGARCCRSA